MKFTKHIALITAFLMLVSNAGFAMTVHYCGGKISSVSSGFTKKTCSVPEKTPEKACCAKSIEKSDKKCCSDKTVSLKGKTIDVIVKKSTSVDLVVPFVLPMHNSVVFGYEPTVKTEKAVAYYCQSNAPPLFKLYHKYILYA